VRPPGLAFGGLVGHLREQGLQSHSEILEVGRVTPPAELNAILDLQQHEEVLVISRLIYVKGSPLALAQTYMNVPDDFDPTIQELEESESVFVLLERDQGISITRGDHEIWATGASIEEANYLDISPGDSILVVETKLYSRNDSVIGWRRAIHKANEYKYAFTVTR
jgi:GntR family transcriptional regulator